VVLVVSKGDPALVRTRRHAALHFPRDARGRYAGYHPADSTTAIAHLEALRAEGAAYLVFPATSTWWLEHYAAFRLHLDTHYRQICNTTDPCRIYSLLEQPVTAGQSPVAELQKVVAECRSGLSHEPTILDWSSGLELAKLLPQLTVFGPPEPGPVLPYVDKSIDLVVFASDADVAREAEAERVACAVTVRTHPPSPKLDVKWLSVPARRSASQVSLIIPCHNQAHLTEACLKSLFATLPPAWAGQVCMVDDASSDSTPDLLARWAKREPRLHILRNATNAGFIAACNRAARRARGEILIFLNNDLILLPNWLDPLLDVLRAHPNAGAVGGKLIYPDGRLQEAGGVVFCDGSAMNFARGEARLEAPHIDFVREVDYCSGALLATRKRLFERLGGFDAHYAPAYYEDADYCFRLRQLGYRSYYQPASAVVHREGGTAGTNPNRGVKRHQGINRRRFFKRWQTILHHQPVRPMLMDQTALYSLALRSPPVPHGNSARGRHALICAAFPPEPDRDSGSRRMLDLIRMFQAEGWAVTFFAWERLGDPRYVRDLQLSGVAVFCESGVRLERLLAAGQFDLASLHSWTAAEITLPVIRRHSPATRVLIDSVDLHFLRHAREVFTTGRAQALPAQLDSRFGNSLARELNAYATVDAVLTVSSREANLLSDLIPVPGLVRVLPDVEQPENSNVPFENRRGILFVGSLRHTPNQDALDFLCREILPLLDPDLNAQHPLYIVGHPGDYNLSALTKKLSQVRWVGWVPSVDPYLNAVRLSVVPLRYGAGTKRKLLQSLMAGTPTVSTSVGAEGFDLTNGQHLLLADDAAAFAQAMQRVLTDGRLWRRLSREGRTLIRTVHSRATVRRRFQKLLSDVLAREPRGRLPSRPELAPESTRLDLQQYQDLRDQIRACVEANLPHNARVLVVSRGDDQLLRLGGVQASHFPQNETGVFAGYHPADSEAAIAHLQALHARGAEYLLFPKTAFWWLDYYHGLNQHLNQHHIQLLRNDTCALFQLRARGDRRGARQQPRASRRRRPAQSVSPRGPRPQSRDPEGLSSPTTPQTPPPLPHGQLELTLPRDTSNGTYDVVCFPIIEWAFRFQRPQQLMLRFAAAGHRVFYVAQRFRPAGEPCRIHRLSGNLLEVSLRGPELNVYQDSPQDESLEKLFSSLSALHDVQSLKTPRAIVQLPFWWPLARQARREFGWPVVYDCMDHHAGFHTNHPRMLAAERELLSQADLVVTSSAPLETEARRHNSNVVLVRNGCDYEHFARIRHRTRSAATVVGYYGAIAHWFDAELVADLAERRPDWRFLLVGSTHSADLGRLARLPNVSLPGEQSYSDIPRWLARFDVAILPFKRSPLTESTNPVKAYEIMAAGKPLVSVPLPELLALAPLVQTASTPAEFEIEIERALRLDHPRHIAERRAFARRNTWQERWKSLAAHLPLPLARRKHPSTSPKPVPQQRRHRPREGGPILCPGRTP
jgi:GT2 family glycosyltransferase